MSRNPGADKALEFEVPKDYATWKGVLVTLSPRENDLEVLHYALHSGIKEAAILPGGFEKETNLIGLHHLETIEVLDTLDFLYRTSVLPGDFNHNGKIEYVVLYAFQRKIVYSIIYEEQKEGYLRIKQDSKFLKEWMKSPIASELLRLSGIKSSYYSYDESVRPVAVAEDWYAVSESQSEAGVTSDGYMGNEQYSSRESQLSKDAYNESEVSSKARFGDGASSISNYFATHLSAVANTGSTSEIVVYVDVVIDDKGRCYVINCASNANNADAYIAAIRKGANSMTSWIPATTNGKNVKQKVRFSVKCR
jgi:hypothetical protein